MLRQHRFLKCLPVAQDQILLIVTVQKSRYKIFHSKAYEIKKSKVWEKYPVEIRELIKLKLIFQDS